MPRHGAGAHTDPFVYISMESKINEIKLHLIDKQLRRKEHGSATSLTFLKLLQTGQPIDWPTNQPANHPTNKQTDMRVHHNEVTLP